MTGPERFGMTRTGPATRQAILDAVGDWTLRGGAGIHDVAVGTGVSVPNVRHHLVQLIRDGLVQRNQDLGPGTRYFLAGVQRPKVYAVIVNDQGAEFGRIELPERLLDDDGVSDRRMRVLGRQLQELMRKAYR